MKIGDKHPRLRWKGAVAWFDHGTTVVAGKLRRRWERLGTDPVVIERRYRDLLSKPKAGIGTVDAMLDAFFASNPRHRDTGEPIRRGTLDHYKSYRKHLSDVFGHLDPTEVTQADVMRYMRKCPRTTARGEVGVLSLAYAAAMDDDASGITFNPCFGVKVRGLRKSRRDRLLTDDELDAIVKAARERDDERLVVAIDLAYATGLRISDLCALRWSDVDQVVQMVKTGGRLTFRSTDDLNAILGRARLLQHTVASMFVLCDRRGKPWRPATLRGNHWRNACLAAGVADAHFHDIRAAAASALEKAVDAAGGDGEGAAQRFLGHTMRQTTKTYLRNRQVKVVTPLARRKKA